MKNKQYNVTFTNNSEMQFEAVDFEHLADQIGLICLLSGKEVQSVELII